MRPGIVSINQVQPIFVHLRVCRLTRFRASRARLEEAGDIDVTAKDADGRDLAAGKLSVIDNQINAATGNHQLQGRVRETPTRALWPGQFVNVSMSGIDTLRDMVVAVPVYRGCNTGPMVPMRSLSGRIERCKKRSIKTGVVNKTSAGYRRRSATRRAGRDRTVNIESRPASLVEVARPNAAPAPG